MATNFPTSKDTFTNPTANDKVDVISHADQHANANDAIEALQDKVGVDGSAVTSTHDFKLSNVADGEKAIGTTEFATATSDITDLETADGQNVKLTGDQTITGVKTLTSPVLNTSISGTAFLDEDDMISDSATKVASQQSIKAYIDNSLASGSPRVFSSGDISTQGVLYTDEYFDVDLGAGGVIDIGLESIDGVAKTMGSSFGNSYASTVILGDYVYVLRRETATNPDQYELYRFTKSDVTSTGTQITFSGATVLSDINSSIVMTTDGTDFYFSFEAGNGNQYDIAKYTLLGTVLTYDSTITLSNSANIISFSVKINGDIYASTSNNIYVYNSSGTLQKTSNTNQTSLLNFSNTIYSGISAIGIYKKLLF